jgi:hypothetical protein
MPGAGAVHYINSSHSITSSARVSRAGWNFEAERSDRGLGLAGDSQHDCGIWIRIQRAVREFERAFFSLGPNCQVATADIRNTLASNFANSSTRDIR